jgi:hypothetical protein
MRAVGGFGGITDNNRAVISVLFDTPDGDITLFIGDWYKNNNTLQQNYCRMLYMVFPIILVLIAFNHGYIHMCPKKTPCFIFAGYGYIHVS